MPLFVFKAAKALRDLEERVERLERAQKGLQLEADELYEKTRHALGRISKRTAAPVPDGEEPVNGAAGPPGRPAHIDPKSWAIISKRRGVGPTNRG